MGQYLDRAEYIKKQVLNKPENQIVPTEEPGDSAVGTAKKPPKKK